MWFPLSIRFRCLQILNLLYQFENSCAFIFYWFPVQKHSRPQSPSFLGRLQIKPSGSGDENGAWERFNEADQRNLFLRWRPLKKASAIPTWACSISKCKSCHFANKMTLCSLNRNLEWKVQCRIQTLRWWKGGGVGGGGGLGAVIETVRSGGGGRSSKKFFRPFGTQFGRNQI